MKFTSIVVILWCNLTLGFAQSTAEKVEIYTFKSEVYLSCILSSGNICNGIDILRSKDSINYETIGYISGTCGDINSPTKYSFIDKTPIFNTDLYYKFYFGGFGESAVLKIKVFNLNYLGYQIYPQPANNVLTIDFDNKENFESELSIFNLSGQEIFSEKTSQPFFKIDVSDYAAGFYVLKLKKNQFSEPIVSKIIIQ